MNKKIMSKISYIIAAVSLAVGASFYGYRMHPEDTAKYNIGVTMGIMMISMKDDGCCMYMQVDSRKE